VALYWCCGLSVQYCGGGGWLCVFASVVVWRVVIVQYMYCDVLEGCIYLCGRAVVFWVVFAWHCEWCAGLCVQYCGGVVGCMHVVVWWHYGLSVWY
jgi:hypothetical protein